MNSDPNPDPDPDPLGNSSVYLLWSASSISLIAVYGLGYTDASSLRSAVALCVSCVLLAAYLRLEWANIRGLRGEC